MWESGCRKASEAAEFRYADQPMAWIEGAFMEKLVVREAVRAPVWYKNVFVNCISYPFAGSGLFGGPTFGSSAPLLLLHHNYPLRPPLE